MIFPLFRILFIRPPSFACLSWRLCAFVALQPLSKNPVKRTMRYHLQISICDNPPMKMNHHLSASVAMFVRTWLTESPPPRPRPRNRNRLSCPGQSSVAMFVRTWLTLFTAPSSAPRPTLPHRSRHPIYLSAACGGEGEGRGGPISLRPQPVDSRWSLPRPDQFRLNSGKSD